MRDIIDMKSYKSGYNAGTYDGYNACREEMRQRIIEKKRSRERILYFIKQKIIAVLILMIGFIVSFVLDGDMTCMLLILPLSAFLFFSKRMWYMNDYYYTTKEQYEN